jgi:hypothetical protein
MVSLDIQYCSVGNIPLQGQDKVKSEGQLTGPSAVCLSNCSDPDLSVFIGQGRGFFNDYFWHIHRLNYLSCLL